MTRQSTYNVGIYVRLSQEDMREGESLSIENQKKMLTDYVSQQAGWNLVEICEDDGYSGTNFDRPGIKQILDDAKSGKINLILVKDLSRFGRNYIEVGQYIDYIFPSFNIRFIALSDNVDTLDRNSTAMDLMPIMNFVNAQYGQNPQATDLPIFLFQMMNKSSPPDIFLRRAFLSYCPKRYHFIKSHCTNIARCIISECYNMVEKQAVKNIVQNIWRTPFVSEF